MNTNAPPMQVPPRDGQLRGEHLRELLTLWQSALSDAGLQGAWIEAGSQDYYFQDDHGPRFKPNAAFTQWVEPEFACPQARILIPARGRPELHLPHAADYWHATPPVPEHLGAWLDIEVQPSEQACLAACEQRTQAFKPAQVAVLGRPAPGSNQTLGAPLPDAVQNRLAYHRAIKSPWELALMREASLIGARGHQAAAAAFYAGGTEFDIHMAYLQASGQTDHDLPYGNIVALNRHASLLHYQWQSRSHDGEPRSLLIDAGGNCDGYASDITRTYAAEGAEHDAFRALIELMQQHQDFILSQIRPGISYAQLHATMHENLAQVLVAAGLVECSAEAAFEQGLTRAFCPHGLGHLLGIQVHDAGGHLADAQGNEAPPPAAYPSLRFTRAIAVDQVFTIEPGLYFIDSLLDELRGSAKGLNWSAIDALRDYGGIRIEDNVRVLDEGTENLTRDAWERL